MSLRARTRTSTGMAGGWFELKPFREHTPRTTRSLVFHDQVGLDPIPTVPLREQNRVRESIGTPADWVKVDSGGCYPNTTFFPNPFICHVLTCAFRFSVH